MQDGILFIQDALKDSRFFFNSLVLGPLFICFYAGKPLLTPKSKTIETICLIDSEPREVFAVDDRRNLTDLAALVMDGIEMRRLGFVTVSETRFQNIVATSPDAIVCSNE